MFRFSYIPSFLHKILGGGASRAGL
uniref:Uncharacterized protein n=1 Tax=Anguilla anguilla TaxID=7936 RepID=A0A0E9T6W4_ANGAN